MGCPWSLVEGNAFEVMIDRCLFFDVSWKWEFPWKRDTNAVH